MSTGISFETAKKMILERYSEESQAYAALSYTRLIALAGQAAVTDAPEDWMLTRSQLEICQQQLWRGFRRRNSSHVEVIDPDVPLLRFQETQDVRLPDDGRVSRPRRIIRSELEQFSFGHHYLYVLNPENSIYVHLEPVPIQDLFFPFANANRLHVRHPQILNDGQPVKAAGEICLLGSIERPAVLFNTRSGHYQPPPSSVPPMRQACIDSLGVPQHRVLQLVVEPGRQGAR